MRTTLRLDDDTARAVEQCRRERGIGVSEAVNELIRRGLLPRDDRVAFRQRTRPLGQGSTCPMSPTPSRPLERPMTR